MSDAIIEMHAVVEGRVQGVGFRATVRHYARLLGLTGFARNLPDGNVAIKVQGRKELMEKLLDNLEKHGAPIEIERSQVEFLEILNPYSDFNIL